VPPHSGRAHVTSCVTVSLGLSAGVPEANDGLGRRALRSSQGRRASAVRAPLRSPRAPRASARAARSAHRASRSIDRNEGASDARARSLVFAISTSRLKSSACCSMTRRFKLSMSFGSSTVFAAFAMRALYAHDSRRARQLQGKERVGALHRELPCLRSNRTSPVDAFQGSIQSCACDKVHRTVVGARPDEAAALEPLREQARSVAVPPNYSDPITATTTEHEELTRERILTRFRCTSAANPSKPLRMPVTPQTIQIFVPDSSNALVAWHRI